MTTDPTEYGELLRGWRQRVCEHLGMDPTQVLMLDDTREARGGITLAWTAVSRQESRIGSMYRWAWESSGNADDGPRFTAWAGLSPFEWAEVIAVAGEKPRLLTREQELMLKGLVAEAAERES